MSTSHDSSPGQPVSAITAAEGEDDILDAVRELCDYAENGHEHPGLSRWAARNLASFFRARMPSGLPRSSPPMRKALRDDGIPTRNDLSLMSPAELAITAAMREVEQAGCSEELTEALVLLGRARNSVANHVEVGSSE